MLHNSKNKGLLIREKFFIIHSIKDTTEFHIIQIISYILSEKAEFNLKIIKKSTNFYTKYELKMRKTEQK
jgi:hypothetical protein